MRKYKYSSYSTFKSGSNKHWLRNTLLTLLIGTPLAVVLVELGLKTFVSTSWLSGATSSNVSIAQTYDLKLGSQGGKSYTGGLGELQVSRSPLVGYQLVPKQNNKLWQINAQGFRADKPLPVDKQPNDIRVFMIGSSTAFGTMTANNQATIATKLEELLNRQVQEQIAKPKQFQPRILPYYADQIEAIKLLPPRIREGKYQVITAAVPGYTFNNELSLLLHQVLEFNPDAIIFLNGYEDLRSPSQTGSQVQGKIEEILENPDQYYRRYNQEQFDNWLNSFYVVKVYRRLFAPASLTASSGYQTFDANQLADNAEELNLRVSGYDLDLRKIANLKSKIPMIVAIQPEITGKGNALSPEETKILKSLGDRYRDRMVKAYTTLESRVLNRSLANIKVISFYQLYKDFNQRAFYDPIHLTDAANDVLAKQLLSSLESQFVLPSQAAPEPTPR
jgi:hypothetical protein